MRQVLVNASEICRMARSGMVTSPINAARLQVSIVAVGVTVFVGVSVAVGVFVGVSDGSNVLVGLLVGVLDGVQVSVGV